jgi:uncharacterized protein involved in cysteine biosynthesis
MATGRRDRCVALGMRPSRFFDWLHDVVPDLPDWLGRLLGTVLVLCLAVALYRGVRHYQ